MSCLLFAPFSRDGLMRDWAGKHWGRYRPHPASVCVDSNAFDVRARPLGFRKRHSQDAVLEIRLGLVFLDALQWNLTFERSVVALSDEFRFVIAFGLLLTADRENAVGDLDLNVLFSESREFGRNRNCLVGLAKFEPGPAELALHSRT